MIVQDSIFPDTSRVMSPLTPEDMGAEPASTTKLIVLVKSAVVDNPTTYTFCPEVGAVVKIKLVPLVV
mgnify:CR=1 FL=1